MDYLDSYFVWDPRHGGPNYKHLSYESAEREAKRMAEIHKGQEFLVIRVLAAAKVREPVEVRRVGSIDQAIPF